MNKKISTVAEAKKVGKDFDPDYKRAWNRLCAAVEDVGWKDLQQMILRVQEHTNDTSYRLRKQ